MVGVSVCLYNVGLISKRDVFSVYNAYSSLNGVHCLYSVTHKFGTEISMVFFSVALLFLQNNFINKCFFGPNDQLDLLKALPIQIKYHCFILHSADVNGV